MDRMLAYFITKRKRHPNIDEICRKIICERKTPSDGITIVELKDAYSAECNKIFPIRRCITEFLLTIPNVAVYSNEYGTRFFYTIE